VFACLPLPAGRVIMARGVISAQENRVTGAEFR